MFVSFDKILVLLVGLAAAEVATPGCEGCSYNKCFFKDKLPKPWQAPASSFCESLLKSTPTPVTKTRFSSRTTITSVVTVTPKTSTSVSTSTSTSIETQQIECQTTGDTVPAPTFVNYPTRKPTLARKSDLVERNAPEFMTKGCTREPLAKEIKSACSCFLTAPTVWVTPTRTIISRTTIATPVTTVVSVIPTATTTTTCTTTNTVNPVARASNCGAPDNQKYTAQTTGYRTCDSSQDTGTSINALHQIEGSDSEGTIFDDCILASPGVVNTDSGGSHLCDGTNNNANPSPFATITNQLDAAAKAFGFSWDGTYSNTYKDYFIQRISQTAQSGNAYWGILRNAVFTQAGGCEEEVAKTDRTLWAFDAFNKNSALRVTPDYVVAKAGQGSVTVNVAAVDTNNGDQSPATGAAFAGQTVGSDGTVTVQIPVVPGCYQYKATRGNSIRSNVFFINAVDQFDSA